MVINRIIVRLTESGDDEAVQLIEKLEEACIQAIFALYGNDNSKALKAEDEFKRLVEELQIEC